MCRTAGDAVRTNPGLSDLPLLQKHQLASTSKCCVCKVVTKGPLSSKGNFATFWLLNTVPWSRSSVQDLANQFIPDKWTSHEETIKGRGPPPWAHDDFIASYPDASQRIHTYIVAPHTTAASTWTSKYSYKILRNCVGAYCYHLNYLSHLLKQNNLFACAKWSLH
jgi:hypothetical protein